MRYRSIRVQVSKLHLEIFSLPQAIEKSRQFLLLRTDILQKKQSSGAPDWFSCKERTIKWPQDPVYLEKSCLG